MLIILLSKPFTSLKSCLVDSSNSRSIQFNVLLNSIITQSRIGIKITNLDVTACLCNSIIVHAHSVDIFSPRLKNTQFWESYIIVNS